MIDKLKEFWSKYIPYKLHPDDENYLGISKSKYCLELSINQLRNRYGNDLKSDIVNESFASNKSNRKKIMSNIFAIPFLGDVENARVYILMGNPGFETGDYVDEIENANYIQLLKNNINLKSKNFICLEDMAINTGGYKYWYDNRRMLKILKLLDNMNNLTTQENFEYLKNSICIIQSVAYHSCKKPDKELYNLPSSLYTKKLVNEYVQKRIEQKDSLCFVWRSATFWNLRETENLIERSPKKAQLAGFINDEAPLIANFINSKI